MIFGSYIKNGGKGDTEGAHLTLPRHNISVQVKSRSMLPQGSVGASLKQNKRNLTPTLTLNVLLPSNVFHNKI